MWLSLSLYNILHQERPYRCFGLINSLLGAKGGTVPSITWYRSSLWSQILDATWTLPPELRQLKTYPDLDTCPLLSWSRVTLTEKGCSVPHSLPYRNQLQENSHQRAMPLAWIKSDFFVLRNSCQRSRDHLRTPIWISHVLTGLISLIQPKHLPHTNPPSQGLALTQLRQKQLLKLWPYACKTPDRKAIYSSWLVACSLTSWLKAS